MWFHQLTFAASEIKCTRDAGRLGSCMITINDCNLKIFALTAKNILSFFFLWHEKGNQFLKSCIWSEFTKHILIFHHIPYFCMHFANNSWVDKSHLVVDCEWRAKLKSQQTTPPLPHTHSSYINTDLRYVNTDLCFPALTAKTARICHMFNIFHNILSCFWSSKKYSKYWHFGRLSRLACIWNQLLSVVTFVPHSVWFVLPLACNCVCKSIWCCVVL